MIVSIAFLLAPVPTLADPLPRFDGVNVIAVPEYPFGSAAAEQSLLAAKSTGAGTVAIIPFLWQASPSSTVIDRGNDMPDATLRAAIRQAHAAGLKVMVKPHVWVPESWAGAVLPATDDGWRQWFASYRAVLRPIVRIATEEQADAFVVGTELTRTIMRPEWREVITDTRAAFPGTLLYVAHDIAEAEAMPFWDRLDAVGVSLYPPLGGDHDRPARLAAMNAIAGRLDALSARIEKPVIVAEVGLRSAQGAAAKPWESAEERAAIADPQLQAEVLADWFAVLDRPEIRGVMVWRWFTDPQAGGSRDTDFTVQRKPAEGVLMCAWLTGCAKRGFPRSFIPG